MNSAKEIGPWRAMRRRMARSARVGGKSVVVRSVAILLLLSQLRQSCADLSEGVHHGLLSCGGLATVFEEFVHEAVVAFTLFLETCFSSVSALAFSVQHDEVITSRGSGETATDCEATGQRRQVDITSQFVH